MRQFSYENLHTEGQLKKESFVLTSTHQWVISGGRRWLIPHSVNV